MATVVVISAVYNTARFLRETVESVAAQTMLPEEHILIDDCSTDNSLSLARQLEYEFQHVRVITHERNRGYPAALNTGLLASHSEFVGILDSDDIAMPHWLKTVVPVLEADSRVGAIGGGCVMMTEKGEVTGCEMYCEESGDIT
ncbi:MAG: glycosyltransferase family A protein, partial [Ferruginibacter sp.]